MQTNIDTGTLAPPLRALFEGQQAALEALRAEVASLTEQNRRLEHLLNELRRAMFGKKSEKLHPDQLLLAFEALEGALAEAEEQAPASPAPRAKRNIGHLPERLPRIEDVIEPGSTLCPCGCGEMARIGADRTERLDIVPVQLRVIVTVRPRYACRLCEQGVTQAPAPAHLIEGAIPTEGAIAHGPVSKFADHLSAVSSIADPRPFGHRVAPFDTGRLGRQGVVPPAARVRPPDARVEDVGQAGAGRDDGSGPGPGPGQDEDGLHVDDGARRAGAARRGPARLRVRLCPAAPASMARNYSRASRERCRSTATPGTTGCAGRTVRTER